MWEKRSKGDGFTSDLILFYQGKGTEGLRSEGRDIKIKSDTPVLFVRKNI